MQRRSLSPVKRRCLLVLALLSVASRRVDALQCWQCASVGGRKCPNEAETVDSGAHDACVTWRLGNGTVILQNAVRYDKECTPDKVQFWTNFVAMFYSSPGSGVKCCSADGCNSGDLGDGAFLQTASVSLDGAFGLGAATGTDGGAGVIAGGGSGGSGGAIGQDPSFPSSLPGAPMMFGGVGGLQSGLSASPSPSRMDPIAQQQQQLMALLGGGGLGPSSFSMGMMGNMGGGGALQMQPSAFQQNGFNALAGLAAAQQGGLGMFSNQMGLQRNAGNCQRYFPSHGDDEWLPSPLVPLFYDRASGRRIGVFYAKFTAIPNNQDNIIVRMVGKDRSNRTLYTFKIGQDSLALYVSTLDLNARGEYDREEIRRASEANAVNLTDTSKYHGFWFTFSDEEITFGHIGDRLVEPVLVHNITRRDGPDDVAYFALTTEESQASFGINCEAPDLHFDDTCVSDEDCEDFANTVCATEPINTGLDPGARKTSFEDWEERDKILKSCFCKAGHLRIPKSKGCYDPIREVVTLRDACFADYHCDHLPNTRCVSDLDVPKYNKSCQCLPGYKAFDMDPRTGLIEGCAPLTKADRSSVLACSDQFEIDDDPEWVPRDVFPLERGNADFKYAVFFIKLQPTASSRRDNVAVVRLMDGTRSNRKLLSVKFYQNSGKIAITESTRTRSFFFADNQRDQERATVTRADLMSRSETEYIGFWVRYRYEEGTGGTISLGRNGDRFSEEAALLKWTDSSSTAIQNLKYVGFTVTDDSVASFGANCVLADGSPSNPRNSVGGAGAAADQLPLNQASALAGLNAFAMGQVANFNGNNPFFSQISPSTSSGAMGQFQQGQSALLPNPNAATKGLGGTITPEMLAALQQQMQQQQQQMQQALSGGGNNYFQSPFLMPALSRQSTDTLGGVGGGDGGGGDLADLLGGVDDVEEKMEPQMEEEVIIEPVLRNKFLTRVKKRMLAGFEGESGEDGGQEQDS